MSAPMPGTPATPDQAAHGPLHGYRVIELTQIVAGPSCGRILGELGAEVIKVEQPTGDPHRSMYSVVPDEGKRFQALNPNKKSIVIDLQRPEGKEILRTLLKDADVLLTNFRFGVPDRLGFGYEAVKEINPRLVYGRVTGFGSKSEAATKPAGDVMMQSYSGLTVNGGKLNEEGLPVLANNTIADYSAGMGCAIGIISALLTRMTTGRGQLVDASLLRGALVLQDTAVMREPTYDREVRDQQVEEMQSVLDRGGPFSDVIAIRTGGNRRNLNPGLLLFNGPHQAQDGVVTLGALTPANREAAKRALSVTDEDLATVEDPNAPGHEERLAALRERVNEVFQTKTCQEWVDILDREGCPSAKVNIPEMMSDDPIVVAEGHMSEVVHTVTGPQRIVSPLVDLSETPTRHRQASPALGEHTREVLTTLGGLTDADVDRLASEGVVREYVAAKQAVTQAATQVGNQSG